MHKRLTICGLPLFLLLLGVVLCAPTTAWAQDDPEEDEGDDDDDDGGGEEIDIDRDRRESPRARQQKKTRKRIVREVVKGFYAKLNFGPLIWLPAISSHAGSTGTAFDLSLGGDVIDRLGFTLSVEGSFFQVVANAAHGYGVGDRSTEAPNSPIQGDFRVFGGIVGVRAGPNLGGQKAKRLSIAVHAAGGVGYSPVLIDLTAGEAARNIGNRGWGILQGGALGLVQAGLGVEYYTRLAHFSLGLDIDYDLILGGPVPAMGLGIDIFVKYTF
jgi:hypothetical protein